MYNGYKQSTELSDFPMQLDGTLSRDKHLQLTKESAFKILDEEGDVAAAVNDFTTNMRNHSELANNAGVALLRMLLEHSDQSIETPEKLKEYINAFK